MNEGGAPASYSKYQKFKDWIEEYKLIRQRAHAKFVCNYLKLFGYHSIIPEDPISKQWIQIWNGCGNGNKLITCYS